MAAGVRVVRSIASCVPRRSVWWINAKHVSTTQRLYSEDERLEQAKNRVTKLKEDPGNTVKLQLYALYKQARQIPIFLVHCHASNCDMGQV